MKLTDFTPEGPGVGDEAPDFTLPEASEVMVTLSEKLKKQAQVLAFYPTDFGIICTLEFKRLKEMSVDLSKAGIGLLGISVNSARSHRTWKEKMSMDIALLSDGDAKVSRKYNVMCPEDSILRGHSGRAIIIVDRCQVIRYRWIATNIHEQPDYDQVMIEALEVGSNGEKIQ